MERETGLLQLLASLLLTGRKGVDLVIRGKVVLNILLVCYRQAYWIPLVWEKTRGLSYLNFQNKNLRVNGKKTISKSTIKFERPQIISWHWQPSSRENSPFYVARPTGTKDYVL
jgi:hypothetical protein